MEEVIEGVWLGDIRAAQNIQLLKEKSIKHIIQVTDKGIMPMYPSDFKYKVIEIQDTEYANISRHFIPTINYIRNAMVKLESTLIYCFSGNSPSVTLMAAFIIKDREITSQQALQLIKRKIKDAKPNQGFQLQLHQFQLQCDSKRKAQCHQENQEFFISRMYQQPSRHSLTHSNDRSKSPDNNSVDNNNNNLPLSHRRLSQSVLSHRKDIKELNGTAPYTNQSRDQKKADTQIASKNAYASPQKSSFSSRLSNGQNSSGSLPHLKQNATYQQQQQPKVIPKSLSSHFNEVSQTYKKQELKEVEQLTIKQKRVRRRDQERRRQIVLKRRADVDNAFGQEEKPPQITKTPAIKQQQQPKRQSEQVQNTINDTISTNQRNQNKSQITTQHRFKEPRATTEYGQMQRKMEENQIRSSTTSTTIIPMAAVNTTTGYRNKRHVSNTDIFKQNKMTSNNSRQAYGAMADSKSSGAFNGTKTQDKHESRRNRIHDSIRSLTPHEQRRIKMMKPVRVEDSHQDKYLTQDQQVIKRLQEPRNKDHTQKQAKESIVDKKIKYCAFPKFVTDRYLLKPYNSGREVKNHAKRPFNDNCISIDVLPQLKADVSHQQSKNEEPQKQPKLLVDQDQLSREQSQDKKKKQSVKRNQQQVNMSSASSVDMFSQDLKHLSQNITTN